MEKYRERSYLPGEAKASAVVPVMRVELTVGLMTDHHRHLNVTEPEIG